jgi:hypothetical protein
MGNSFGLNILAQTVRDRAALLNWIQRAQPAACLVMDSGELAQQVRQRSPNTLVIHRAYNPNDARWEASTTPAAWLAAHLPFAANGVALQLYNEPSPGNLDAFLSFLEGVCSLCPPNVALAFPNFAVGNPHEADILAGKYDRLLKLVCGTRHILSLHEYFRDAPVSEAPYLCGRFTYWLERAKQLGLTAPRIVITEFGRDHGGGRHDGWRDQGWSEAQYWARLLKARELYKQYSIPVCIFGYGRGFSDDWASFDVEGATELLNNMASYREGTSVTTYPAPTTGGERVALADVPNGVYVNIRAQPNPASATSNNAAKVGELLIGDEVEYFPNAKEGEWVYVRILNAVARASGRQNAANGWVSLKPAANASVSFVPPVLPSEPKEAAVTFTDEQWQRWQALLAEQPALTEEYADAVAKLEAVQARQRSLNERTLALLQEVTPSDADGGF